MIDFTLLIGGVGAITGIISLSWHILNSRSKVILERVHFTRSHRHTHKEVIDIVGNIRNKGNSSTTIEEIYLSFGNRWIPLNFGQPIKLEANSSYPFNLHQNFTPEEFKEILEDGKIKLGVDIIHTFNTIKKYGYTDFSTDYLNL